VSPLSKVWTPLSLGDLPDFEVLACDPSLTALGLVWLVIKDGKVSVKGAEKLTVGPTERKGWDDTFARASVMEALVDALVDDWFGSKDVIDVERSHVNAVHEAPPAGGGDFVRTEASVLTGYGFRQVAGDWKMKVLPTVTPQSHKKLISGNHIAKKKEHHDALKLLLPTITGSEKVKNEATRDALSIGLYAADRIAKTLAQ
jgi:hypothetical protein